MFKLIFKPIIWVISKFLKLPLWGQSSILIAIALTTLVLMTASFGHKANHMTTAAGEGPMFVGRGGDLSDTIHLVPGDSLRLLVITQLPFAHVEDPIRRSRSMALARDGKNPYMLIDLPEMLITLKQGIGRLIRSESDRGVVVIADARARRYIQLIRSCIPPYYVPDDEGLTVSSFGQRVEDFLFS